MKKISDKTARFVEKLRKSASDFDCIVKKGEIPPTRVKAEQRASPAQIIFFLFLLLLCFFSLYFNPRGFLSFAGVLSLGIYAIIIGHKIIAVMFGLLFHDEEEVDEETLKGIDEADLPFYTVLIPLYREAGIVAETVKAMTALDYPREKLEILLLAEQDDFETISAIQEISLPPYFEMLIVPRGEPRTKPRACNFGLQKARGELLVVFDAEDRPQKDQLRKAAAIFARSGERLVCLQAKLNFYNAPENLLTKCFALEYSAWFDLFLPGLHTICAPIPLGGTSNHFRINELRHIGGWDPYNVTEDCDLGIELSRFRMETKILSSTTWEECPSDLGAWMRQRSRWMKGYLQTFLVHSRNPFQTVSRMDLLKYLQLWILVGGHVYAMLMNPVSWIVLLLWSIFRWNIFCPESPLTLLAVVLSVLLFSVNFMFVVIHAIAGYYRGIKFAPLVSLLLPFYWGAMSIGAVRGFLQFLRLPYFWEKTPHGHSFGKSYIAGNYFNSELVPAKPNLSRGFIFLFFFFIISAIAFVAAYVPIALHYPQRIRMAAISLAGPGAQSKKDIESCWIGKSAIEIEAKIKADENPSSGFFKFKVFLKVNDGEWYQHHVEQYSIEASSVFMRIPLDSGWEPKDCDKPWGEHCLRRVRELGVKIFGERDFPLRQVEIENFALIDAKQSKKLDCKIISAPDKLSQWETAEFAFFLSKEYENPFDPNVIDINMRIATPSGSFVVPAFYFQDYWRRLEGENEILTARDAPHWRARWTPIEAGRHVFSLEAKDNEGGSLKKILNEIEVRPTQEKGFAKIDESGNYFSWSNGDFFYPMQINIRSPNDNKTPFDANFANPPNEKGTFSYDYYLEKMYQNKINSGRIWMSPWFAGIEWRKDCPGFHGLGHYNMQNAWRLDYILDNARKKNILIELALLHHGPFTKKYDSQWDENPYNYANGGFLKNHHEILSSLKAREMIKKRFRYIAARYGSYTSLFAWTLWIEVNVVCNNNHEMMESWHKDIGDFLKNCDLSRHPISTEFSTSAGSPPVWKLPCIDYVQVAAYDSGYMGLTEVFSERVNDNRNYSKPLLIEEYGGFWDGGSMEYIAHSIHDGLWAGWNMPLAGSPMPWWWNFIFEKNLCRFYKTFSRYIEGEDLRNEDWSFYEFDLRGSDTMKCLIRVGKNKAYGWIFDKKVTNPQPPRNGKTGWRPELKDIHENYRKIVANDFSPLKDEKARIFTERHKLSLTIPGLEKGFYFVEFWNTWIDEEPAISHAESDGKNLTIALPPLQSDIAFKIKR